MKHLLLILSLTFVFSETKSEEIDFIFDSTTGGRAPIEPSGEF